ncbi:hypothetical protein Celaphus_00000504, partial [Cervus elaphus hippelaphus]
NTALQKQTAILDMSVQLLGKLMQVLLKLLRKPFAPQAANKVPANPRLRMRTRRRDSQRMRARRRIPSACWAAATACGYLSTDRRENHINGKEAETELHLPSLAPSTMTRRAGKNIFTMPPKDDKKKKDARKSAKKDKGPVNQSGGMGKKNWSKGNTVAFPGNPVMAHSTPVIRSYTCKAMISNSPQLELFDGVKDQLEIYSNKAGGEAILAGLCSKSVSFVSNKGVFKGDGDDTLENSAGDQRLRNEFKDAVVEKQLEALPFGTEMGNEIYTDDETVRNLQEQLKLANQEKAQAVELWQTASQEFYKLQKLYQEHMTEAQIHVLESQKQKDKLTSFQQLTKHLHVTNENVEMIYREGRINENDYRKLEEMHQRCLVAERSKDDLQLRLKTAENKIKQLEINSSEEISRCQEMIQKLQNILESERENCGFVNEQRLKLQQENEELQKQTEDLRKSALEVQKKAKLKISTMEHEFSIKEHGFEVQLREMEDSNRNSTVELRHLLATTQKAANRWKEETKKLTESAEIRISNLKSELSRQKLHTQELLSQLEMANEKVVEHEKLILEHQEKSNRLQRRLSEAEQRAASASQQGVTIKAEPESSSVSLCSSGLVMHPAVFMPNTVKSCQQQDLASSIYPKSPSSGSSTLYLQIFRSDGFPLVPPCQSSRLLHHHARFIKRPECFS